MTNESTTTKTDEQMDVFQRFLTFFKSYRTESGSLKYREAIQRLPVSGERSVVLDFNELLRYDPQLAKQIIDKPDSIKEASEAIKNIVMLEDPDYVGQITKKGGEFKARLRNLEAKVKLRMIRAEHIGKLIMVDGIVTRVSEVKPQLVIATFKCAVCEQQVQVPQVEGRYTPPVTCPNPACKREGPFNLVVEESAFVDWQKIRIQEMPEELPPGQMPRSTDAILKEDLVDAARPGDRVSIIGVLMSVQDFVPRRGRLTTFRTFMDTNYADVIDKESEKVEITPEEERTILDLAKDEWVYQKIIKSIAPSIYGLEDIKEAIALTLFGGVPKTLPDGVKIRGEINTLLVGDPGTAKSVHGSERIYVGRQTKSGTKWERQPIGQLVDYLMARNPQRVLSRGDTEILPLDPEDQFLTQALDPISLKTRQSIALEASRHQAERLINIRTRSGRSVIATPDHSFTTIENGQLRVLATNDLKLGTCLPVARHVELDMASSYIDLMEEFPKADLVSNETINTQVALADIGQTSGRLAASASNVSTNTLGRIVQGYTPIPDGCWLRRTRDTSWFPRFLDLTPALGRILGLYLADGNVECDTVKVTALYRPIKKILRKDFEEVFGKASITDQAVLLCQASIALWFKHNFGTGAQSKQTPSFFLTAPYSFRCSLLSAYFSGDGTVDERGAAVTASTRSIRLAHQLSDVLATLGIFTTIIRRVIRKGRYRGRAYWMLRIQGTDVFKFSKQIGFVSPIKAKKLKQLVARLSCCRRYQSRDIIPNYGALLKKVTKELGIPGKRGYWTRNFLAELRGKTQRQRIGREYLQKVISLLTKFEQANHQSPSLEWLIALSGSDIFWDPIIEIRYLHHPTTVYDIGTSDGHFILAEGNLVTHNSQLLMYTAGIAPRGLYTSGKGSSAAGLCVSADSKILLQSGPVSIFEVVEKQFQGRDCVEYADGIWYVENGLHDQCVLHSRDLRIESGGIDRFWRIRSPEVLVYLRTRTGRELELTAQTSLLSVDKRLGLVWKPASMLSGGDRVATAKMLRFDQQKHIPTVFKLIEDYPNDLLLIGLKNEVSSVVSKIIKRLGITKRRLAEMLGVSEDSIYRWMNERTMGNISLKHFAALCRLLGEDAEAHLKQELTIQARRGLSIRFPKQFGQELFYILGLVAGDGRISVDKRKPKGHESVTIGLSNREPYLLNRFSEFFKRLGFKVAYSPGSTDRAPEVRICSSLIFHIFSKFGLRWSPKSNTISPSPDLMCIPHEHLSAFIRGLFDTDGWLSTRKDNKSGSCQLGFSSTSRRLADFVQDALSTRGIVAFLRERPPSGGTTRDGRLIEGRHLRHELSVSNYVDICAFTEHFGFENPLTCKRLLSYCNKPRKYHRNVDNVPDVSIILSRLMAFYDTKVFEIDGKKIRLPPTRINHAMNREMLPKILSQLRLDWRRHRVKPPFAWRNRLFQESENALPPDELSKRVGLTRAQAYEYFLRKRGMPGIPLYVILRLMSSTQHQLSKETKEYWSEVINEAQMQHRKNCQDYQMLRSLSNPDIFWDEILEVEQRQARHRFVYDLTIPGTHNFIANGFLVHNTAAVLRDSDTGDMTLEAGALVLADRGVACLHPSTKVIFDDHIVAVGSLFDENLKMEATSCGENVQICAIRGRVKSFDISGLDSVDDECTLVRRKWHRGMLVRAKLASGFEVMLTPNHRLVDGNSLQWKEIGSFKIGEFVLAPLKMAQFIGKRSQTAVADKVSGISRRDHLVDKIVSIDHEHYDGWVYDLHTKHHHNFVGNGVLMHNCVDEFDKMNPQDRVAIHQAMEQQSYHPLMEVALADGTRTQIGMLVDSLFLEHRSDVVQGVKCEILDARPLDVEVFTTDFRQVKQVHVDRLSRHRAPDHFFRIVLSNGREIVVTPDHPFFAFKKATMTTVPAAEIEIGDFVPGFRVMPCGHNPGAVLTRPASAHFNAKTILLPETMTPKLARLLGYFVSEGFTHFGASAELGFSNTSDPIIDDITALMRELFGLEGANYIDKDRSIRYISAQLRDLWKLNFPQILVRAAHKRVPPQLFTSGRLAAIAFLQSAFLGDGSVESESVCYRTSSHKLACDYQDLLLCIGIQSRIAHDTFNNSYKVYISGASLLLFYNTIIEPWDPRRDRVARLASRSEAANRNHDVFPPGIGVQLKRLYKEVGRGYRGTFYWAIKNRQGITRLLLRSCLAEVKDAFSKSKKMLGKCPGTVKDARLVLNWSQETTAERIGATRSFIDYAERNGYSREVRQNLVASIMRAVLETCDSIEAEIKKLDSLLENDLCFLRVRKTERIENKGKWFCPSVYDVTVEPNHCFISHGAVLHNTISIAKAGIVATLNARTAILAAANPAQGRYNAFKNPAENISLPVTVLSRFDLIFIITDKPESERDKKMADHVLSLHSSRGAGIEAPIPPQLLRKYISYAKRNMTPVLTPEAAAKLEEFYLETRAIGENPESPVPITARQLEAIVRLTEARAKMGLKKEITIENAEAVIRLMKTSLKQVGIDRETGRPDIDTIMVGAAKSQRERLDLIMQLVRELGKGSKEGIVSVDSIIEAAKSQGQEEQFVKRTIEKAVKEGVLFEPRQGFVKIA